MKRVFGLIALLAVSVSVAVAQQVYHVFPPPGMQGTQAGNKVIATPDASSGGLTLRALTANDIPGVTVRYNVTGSVSFASTDNGNLIVQNNGASTWTAAAPAVGTSGIVAGAYQVIIQNNGTGSGTFTPTTSTVNSSASLTINPGQSFIIFTDNTTSPGNYVAISLGVGYNGGANQVVATPNGSSGNATVRALVAADVPTLNASQVTGGTFNGTTGFFMNAALSATGLVPTSSSLGTGANARINNPGSAQLGFVTNATQAGYFDSDQSLHLAKNVFTAGSTPTVTVGSGSCAVGTVTGGPGAGQFVITTGSGSACFFVLTFGNTATNGYRCPANDETSVTFMAQSGHTTTSCTIRIATSSNNDVVVYGPVYEF